MIKSMMESYKSFVRKVFDIVYNSKTYPELVSVPYIPLIQFLNLVML